MTIQSKSYMNFLGGEVSSNVYKRLDMANNGKWFETAKNIYFGTTGDFHNRRGFKHIGKAGTGTSSERIKLIPFLFNKKNSYCIEFSSTFFRILKNGELLKDSEDNIITVNHPGLSLADTDDFSYTQVGDILYVCNGNTNGIYTITRNSETNWSWDLFDVEVPPMRSINNNQDKTITFQEGGNYSNSGYYSVEIGPVDGTYLGLVVDALVSGTRTTLYTASGTISGLANFVSDFNSNIDQNAPIDYARLSGNVVVFYLKSTYTLADVTDLRVKVGAGSGGSTEISFVDSEPAYVQSGDHYVFTYPALNANSAIKEIEFVMNTNSVYINPQKRTISKTYVTAVSPSQAVTDIRSDANFTAYGTQPDYILGYDSTNRQFYVGKYEYYSEWSSGFVCGYLTRIKSEYTIAADAYYTASSTPISTLTVYTATANFNFFQDKQVGEIFSVDSIYSPSTEGKAGENKSYSAAVSAGEVTTDAFWSNGNWRFVNSGLFDGYIELQYSYDGVDWYTHRTFTSSIRTENSVSYGTNYNEYGTIDSDDNIQLRLHMKITNAVNLRVTLDTESFKNRSYYKILEKDYLNPNIKAVVSCIKYPVGTPGLVKIDPLTLDEVVNPIIEWAEPAWSEANGYPKVVFLYQNRLGLANTNKDYSTIWFSRTDNYKDFSTEVEYKDDDPITITVLKPTGISEITGVEASKKLFVFSGDREYGIKDEGALTQANKELVSFSTYGSEPIETRVVSNRVVFVESGGRAARSLVYDYSQENYQAPDLTIPFKHLLTNETIIATEYLPGEYKCYLMLTSIGRLLMFKYIPEQKIEACSWFKHSYGNITNVCVVETEGAHDLYVCVDGPMGKFIEYMHIVPFQHGVYLDSYREFSSDTDMTYITDANYFNPGQEYWVLVNNTPYKVSPDSNGTIILPMATKQCIVGLKYVSEGTLIEPNLMGQNGTTNYNRKNMFKAHFEFIDSCGFKVGVKNKKNGFKKIYALEAPSVEGQHNLYSSDRSFVLQSSYLEPNMLSFVQEEPYPMHIVNSEVEVDYGGK